MFKDNFVLYISMFCYCCLLIHLTALSLPDFLIIIIIVVIIIDLFEFTDSSEVLGRGLNLLGGAVKDAQGHGCFGGAPHQDRLAAENTQKTGNLQG